MSVRTLFRLSTIVFVLGSLLSSGRLHAQTFREVSSPFDVQSDPLASLFGASIVDVNSDGLVDIYQPSRIYIQQPDGSFRNTMQTAGIDRDGYTVFGGVFADTDHDGFLDVFFMDLLSDSSRFYTNDSGLWYLHSNEASGIVVQGEVQGSIFADFNGDGPIDLFVGEEYGNNQLFLGSMEGLFTDVTTNAGIVFPPHAYGAAAADYDEDGDLDIFIAACSPVPELSVNLLFQNQGDGTFVEVATAAGVGDDLDSWGVVWIDYDADGLLDLYIVNMPAPDGRPGTNRLYRNLGDGGFEDTSSAAGVTGTDDELSLGASAADFDNDGWIDLYVANLGFPDRMYINNRDGTFRERAAAAGLTDLQFHRSVAVGDINGDGWIDVFAGTEAPPFNKLFYNEGGSNNFLTISLRGTGGNGFGIGARLRLYSGGLLQMRDITAGDGMTSQNHALSAHFGLGAATNIDSLVIRWPSGTRERYTGLEINRHVTLVEGVGENEPPGVFTLTGPDDGSVFYQSDDVSISWNAPADVDELTYSLSVRDELGELYYEESGITSTSAVIPGFVTKAQSSERRYDWTIAASDGHSVRRANRIGSFVRLLALSTESDEVPESLSITSLYPVPATNGVRVGYSIDHPQLVSISIVDILGRVVKRISPAMKLSGDHMERLDTGSLSPGAYFLVLRGDDLTRIEPVIIAR